MNRREVDRLPGHLKACLPGLIVTGAVESAGRGRGTRYLLTRDPYATYKALSLKRIRDSTATGARMDEFRKVLPTLARSPIQVLLRELRKAQLVHSVGVTKAARWFRGAGPANCKLGQPWS